MHQSLATTATPQGTGCSIKTMSSSAASCHNSTMTTTKRYWGRVGSQIWAQGSRLLWLLPMPRWWDDRTMMRGRRHRRGAMVLGQGDRWATVSWAWWSWRKLRRNLWCYHTSAKCWKKNVFFLVHKKGLRLSWYSSSILSKYEVCFKVCP